MTQELEEDTVEVAVDTVRGEAEPQMEKELEDFTNPVAPEEEAAAE